MPTNITYKNSTLTTITNGQSKILKTIGKYMEDDLIVTNMANNQSLSITLTPTTYQQIQNITPGNGYEGLSAVTVTVSPIPSSYIIPSGTINIASNTTGIDVTSYANAVVNVSPSLTTASVTPSETAQNITPGAGYDGLSSVTVAGITNTYIGSSVPRPGSSGIRTGITEGYYKISLSTGYYSLVKKSLGLENKTVVPSETEQVKRPSSNDYYLESVTVAAITPTYVGSGVTTNPSITVSGPTVTVPSGYYSSENTKTINNAVLIGGWTFGAAVFNTLTIDENGLITATRNYTAESRNPVSVSGYVPQTGLTIKIDVPANTKTYQLPTLPAQTFTPSSTTQTVASTGKYMLGDITVQPIPSEYIVPTGTLTITHAGTTSVTNYANVDVPEVRMFGGINSRYKTENNVRKWEVSSNIIVDPEEGGSAGWADEGVYPGVTLTYSAVPSGITITPTQTTQTIGGTNYMMEGPVTVASVTTGYLKGMLALPTDIDFSTGHTPTATWTVEPSGMVIYQCYGTGSITNAVYSSGYIENTQQIPAEYEAGDSYQLPTQGATTVIPSETAQTLSVNQKYMTGNVTVAAITSTYVGSGITRNPTITVSGPSVTIPAGYYSSQQTKTVASGSVDLGIEATVEALPTITVSANGLITALNNSTGQVEIEVNPGYISGNTTGTIGIAGESTRQLPTQGATTITPSSSTQTIAGQKYLTGTITVNPIPSQYIVPSGTYTISSVDSTNTFNVTNYASAKVTITDADSIAY